MVKIIRTFSLHLETNDKRKRIYPVQNEIATTILGRDAGLKGICTRCGNPVARLIENE